MPQVFDNISESLLPALRNTLQVAHRADFCIGYFNLRGWRSIDDLIERWPGGDDACCRLLVGMQPQPHEELRRAMRLAGGDAGIDNQSALRLRRQLADRFREQLTLGAPTADDEAGLRRLARQLRGGKVVVKLFCRCPLHAKLYLFVERLWRSVKYEEVYLHAYEGVAAARAGLGRSFRFYNAERRHQGLGRRTPDAVYADSDSWLKAA